MLFNYFDKTSYEPDARTYVMLLQFIKHEYNVLQEQTSNATVLSQIRSHKARRSQICKNVYKTPYPGEVYRFASQKLGKLQQRVDELLQEFPENQKLLQIKQTF